MVLWSGKLDEIGRDCDGCPMNVEIIRERLKEFRPFAVVTSSGNKYPVPHSDFILLHARTVVVVNDRGGAVVLDPLHVVGLEDVPARRNGHHKRR